MTRFSKRTELDDYLIAAHPRLNQAYNFTYSVVEIVDALMGNLTYLLNVKLEFR